MPDRVVCPAFRPNPTEARASGCQRFPLPYPATSAQPRTALDRRYLPPPLTRRMRHGPQEYIDVLDDAAFGAATRVEPKLKKSRTAG